MKKLANKVALVTSGTRGIGLQCVKTLAQHGATVYIGARRLEAANQICQELLENGYHAKMFTLMRQKQKRMRLWSRQLLKKRAT